MNENIEVEVHYSVDDYVRGTEFTHSRGLFYKYNYLIAFLISLVSFFIFYWLVIRKGDESWDFNDTLMLILGLMIMIPLTYALKDSKPITGNYVAKQYKSSPLLQEAHVFTFNENGIESRSNSSEGKINWSAIIEAAETDEDFFFFTSSKMACFVPKRVFTAEKQDQIRKLAERKLGDRAKFLQQARN